MLWLNMILLAVNTEDGEALAEAALSFLLHVCLRTNLFFFFLCVVAVVHPL